MDWLDLGQLKILGQVALAMLLAAFIGYERETAKKPAGLRTHMLVAGASALLVALSAIATTHFLEELDPGLVRVDPVRISEAIVTGVSFLGAGTIIRERNGNHVEGLTTAASLLFSAAVGIGVAMGEIILAVGVTLLALIVLRGLPWIEERMKKEHPESG